MGPAPRSAGWSSSPHARDRHQCRGDRSTAIRQATALGGPMRNQGPFSSEQIDAYLLETVVPLRLACADPDGHPLVLSLWFLWLEGALWCATAPDARVV